MECPCILTSYEQFAYGQEKPLSGFNTSAKEFILPQTRRKVNIHKTSVCKGSRENSNVSGRNLFYFPEVQIKHPHPLAPSSSPFKSLFNVSLFTANHFSPLLMMLTLEPAAN